MDRAMTAAAILRQRLLGAASLSTTTLYDLAIDALDLGLFEEVVTHIGAAIDDGGGTDARLHQVLGLAQRGLSNGPEAVRAFTRAASLAPNDPLIAHSHARSAMEAGNTAVMLYRRAIALAPRNPDVIVGHAAALVEEGQGDVALRILGDILLVNPGWYDGHAAYARIATASRTDSDGTSTVRAALRRYPDDPALWRTLLRLLMDTRRHAEAAATANDAMRHFGSSDEWRRVEAISLSESGQALAAQRLFDLLPAPEDAIRTVQRVRNLVRLDRIDAAAALVERQFDRASEAVLWPYRALLWRLLGDARWSWLEGDERLIGIYDLGLSGREIGAAAAVLRHLHLRSVEMTEQSVRGGTQTDGPLFARGEPEIRMLRDALLAATQAHVAQLPKPQADHPTLIDRRAPLRFAGSWSVRLTDAGFHVDHVHSQGWLSSACHIALPDTAAEPQAGWLTFGECRDLVPALAPFRMVEPKAGRLVLFPSTMWHGTRPFAAGERLSVAFDIARP